ncbi:aldose 1-epimerase family protein [Paenarthrobacter sp. Z7-10]|nr:aldose 1-epimerase family protein [Paenarthrobacter sp. Z7-10]MCZ2403181.1 aldose 1-epimerase family protein [Paenarthrobacter sp. Z7-10]
MAAGNYTAVITAQGAALRRLQHCGRDLVVPFAAGGPIPDYRGIIAAPWPNRIADGSYRSDGTVLHLPINEIARNTALHGLVFDRTWTFQEFDGAAVTLGCELEPTHGYPFSLALQVRYSLDDGGLHTEVTAGNTGGRTAPYGVCPHPYLVAGSSPLDEWVLELAAETFLAVTPDRLLPVARVPVQGHPFDFRTPRALGAVEIDHAFTDLRFAPTGRAELLLHDPVGTGVGMSWDTSCPWLQVHTADKPAPQRSRLGLAVEPMTCPPDAFNSGTDLVLLAPGARHHAGWSIFAR